MIHTSRLHSAFFALTLLAVLAAPAQAAIIQFTLNDPVAYGAPGSTVAFNGTIYAPADNDATIYLNGDSVVTLDYPLTLDDAAFVLSLPVVLAPGESYSGLIFTTALPDYATLYTPFHGTFELLGGSTPDATDSQASADFQVTATPEPGTIALLLMGLSGLALVRRRELKKR